MGNEVLQHLPELLAGLLVTIELTVVSVAVALPVGLGLALLSSARNRWVAWPVIIAVELFRGAPLIVVLQLIYFGLPSAGIRLDAMPSVWIGLGLSIAAYSSEIFRAGIQSVDQGHVEAADALGLSRADTLRFVVFPQARQISLAPLLGLTIQMFQATSLAFALSIPELTSRAYNLGSETFEYLRYLAIAGVLYALVALPAMRVVARLERRQGTVEPLLSKGSRIV